VLARCVEAVDDISEAFRRYQATRLERTARLQLTSRANTWGKQTVDPGWVYGYDALHAPISASAVSPA